MQKSSTEHTLLILMVLVVLLYFPVGFLVGRDIGLAPPHISIALPAPPGTVTPTSEVPLSNSQIEQVIKDLERTNGGQLTQTERERITSQLRTLLVPGPSSSTNTETRTTAVVAAPAAPTTTTTLVPSLPAIPTPPPAPPAPGGCPFDQLLPFCPQTQTAAVTVPEAVPKLG